MLELKYTIWWDIGKYECGYCNKRFNICYYRESNYGRTMSRAMPHAAKANFIRHLESCYKKESNEI